MDFQEVFTLEDKNIRYATNNFFVLLLYTEKVCSAVVNCPIEGILDLKIWTKASVWRNCFIQNEFLRLLYRGSFCRYNYVKSPKSVALVNIGY